MGKVVVKSMEKVNKSEAERISDAADVLAEEKKPKKVVNKPVAKKAPAAKKGLVMDGMVRRPNAEKKTLNVEPLKIKGVKPATKNAEVDKDKIVAEDAAEKKVEDEAPRLSKPKAALLAVGVALGVGLVGIGIISATSKKHINYCTVQFETNGGEEIASTDVVCGQKVARPDDPEREGFDFQDWVLRGLPYDFDENTVDQDIILEAKWLIHEDIEAVTVTFDSNGGSAAISERKVIKGKVTAAPNTTPTRSGYTFMGWTLNGENFDFSMPIEEDITLVAKWAVIQQPQQQPEAEEVKLSKLSLAAITVDEGESKTITIDMQPENAVYELSIKQNGGEIAECSLAGNKLTCTGVKSGEATIIVGDAKSNLTATAKVTVKAVKYTVTFDSNGGSEVSSQQVARNGHAVLPTPPTKDGYEFLHWSLDGEAFNVYTTPITQNITLKAEWKAKEPEAQNTPCEEGNAECQTQSVNNGEVTDSDTEDENNQNS